MLARALEMGFYGGALRRPGNVFEIPDSEPMPGWAEAAEPAAPEPAAGDRKPRAKPASEASPAA